MFGFWSKVCQRGSFFSNQEGGHFFPNEQEGGSFFFEQSRGGQIFLRQSRGGGSFFFIPARENTPPLINIDWALNNMNQYATC